MPEKPQLSDLLQSELAVMSELIDLSLLKKEALLKDDLSALETIVLKEEALSKKLHYYENACSSQVQFFLRGRRDEPDDLSQTLAKLIREIRAKAWELKRNNEFNQDLIKDSLNLVRFAINALAPPEGTGTPVYGSTGKMVKRDKKTLVLDYKR